MSVSETQGIFSIFGGWGVRGLRTHPNFPLVIEMIRNKNLIGPPIERWAGRLSDSLQDGLR